jgi:CheY-like chemotaxis protein
VRKKILIVEDDRDILLTIQELLEGTGYETLVANNGVVALDVLKKTERLPDLIVLDYMMPEMDGGAFRAEQEKDPRLATIPILLMTAYAHPDVTQMRIGAKAYVKKPLDLEKFLSSIETCLQ